MQDVQENIKKLIYCGILFITFIIFIKVIKIYFKPFFIIIFLLVLSSPINSYLSRYKIINNKVRGLFSIVLVNIIIFAFILYLGNWLFATKDVIINGVLKLLLSIKELLESLNINSNLLNGELEGYYLKILNSNLLKKSAIYTTDSIINYFVANIVVYFILVDKYVIFNWTKKIMSESKLSFLKNIFADVKNIIRIEFLIVIAITFETIIGFMILNIDNYFLLGILCGILDLIPYVGTILVFLPLILYNISMKNFFLAFGLIFLYILLLINRQIIEAKLMSNKLKIHPLYTFLAFYIGFRVMGALSIVIMPLYLIFCKSILEA
ncbi:AI-2E family transporter [Clostridium sp. MSJ-11]|uniref:AI-2E family transporter n=1 Tax=Clostridium mobile TaxID=2841512 RepID=A0ABS6EC47_9CLOT|nr:AI-2E family transporter [Clostridium mobile]MBU5482777.1 AI-2E family transporter [Clostridium mobile]